jgi:CBS domain-containing protein
MKAADIMKAPVIWVRPETTIEDAARLMLEKHISGLPVADHSSAVVGMLTEGDLLRRTETGAERHRPRWLEFLIGSGRLAHDYVETHARKVGEVMSTDVVPWGREMSFPRSFGLWNGVTSTGCLCLKTRKSLASSVGPISFER